LQGWPPAFNKNKSRIGRKENKMSLASIFDSPEFKEAKSSKGGNYWKAGIHEATILSVQLNEVRAGTAFIVECSVTSSNPAEGTAPHNVGETVGWITLDNKEKALFFGDIKGFVGGVLEVPEHEIGREEIEYITGEDQPLVGKAIRVEAVMVKTKRGNDFTKIRFAAL